MMYTTGVVTLLWGLSAVFLIAFQCPSPRRWDITNPECMNLVSSADDIAGSKTRTDGFSAPYKPIMLS